MKEIKSSRDICRGQGGRWAFFDWPHLVMVWVLVMVNLVFLAPAAARTAEPFALPDHSRNGDDPSAELYLPLAPLVPDQAKLTILIPAPDTEWVFSTDRKGKLLIVAVAAVEPAEKADQVQWELDPIGDAKITYEPQHGATIKITVEGLPENNDDFGEKTLTASVDGAADSITLKVFFPPVAKNHPGEGEGETPNWFYYWGQTKAGEGGGFFYQEKPPPYKECTATAVGRYSYREDKIYLHDSVYGTECMNRYDNKTAKGLDCFGETIRHEKVHQRELKYWWGSIPTARGDLVGEKPTECDDSLPTLSYQGPRNKIMGIDSDGDFVPDYIEDSLVGCRSDDPISCPGIPFQVIRMAPAGKGRLDVDMNSYRVSWKQWPIGSADSEDWSECGKQWTSAGCGP